MRIVLFGKNGQVAREVQRRAPEGVEVIAIGRDQADFSAPAMVAQAMETVRADAAINAVAYTAVDNAEAEPELANTVNNLSVKSLAESCATQGIPLVHLSTDYVFDGQGDQARAPDASTAPLGVYGATKLAGENAVRAATGAHVVLRTSWVFSAHGANFVKTMLRLGNERSALSIVADQIGGPTPAAAIADAVLTIAKSLSDGGPSGTYHFSGKPDVSWATFAREIFSQAQLGVEVTEIPTSDYPTPATRPLNSRLDCNTLKREFGITRPDWRKGLTEVLKELEAI